MTRQLIRALVQFAISNRPALERERRGKRSTIDLSRYQLMQALFYRVSAIPAQAAEEMLSLLLRQQLQARD